MATTKYIVNNLSGQTITNEPILRPYKVYTALLTQSGDGTNTQTTGPLIIGTRYIITTYEIGDDFTSVANVISGDINTDNCEFIAIGTTPDNYLNGSTLTDTGAPVATVLENTIGNIVWTRFEMGEYGCTLTGAFTKDKTFLTICSNEVTKYKFEKDDDDNISLGSANYANGKGDNRLINTSIEIRVYN
jgi:hypothetical protein